MLRRRWGIGGWRWIPRLRTGEEGGTKKGRGWGKVSLVDEGFYREKEKVERGIEGLEEIMTVVQRDQRKVKVAKV